MVLPEWASRPIVSATGLVPSESRFIIALTLSAALGQLYWTLFVARDGPCPPWRKHVFNIVGGNVLLLLMYDWTAFSHFYTPCLVTFVVLRRWRGARTPLLILAGSLAHLAVYSFYLQLRTATANTVDAAGPMMVNVIKLSTFAFYLCNEHVQHGPVGLLEFVGFVSMFPGILCGPALSYADYRAFVRGDGDFKQLATRGRGRLRRAASRLVGIVTCFAGTLLLTARFPLGAVLTDAFLARPVWRRLVYLHFAMMHYRLRFYFVWLFTELSYVLAGIGYAHDDQWTRMENVKPWETETGADIRQMTADWNIVTSRWLRTCVYNQIVQALGRPGFAASFLTYLVSAFWHGFYPGYYIAFTMWALLNNLSRLLYARLTFPIRSALLRRLMLFPVVATSFTYCLAPFVLQRWDKCMAFYSGFRWAGHVALLGLTAALMVMPRGSGAAAFGPAKTVAGPTLRTSPRRSQIKAAK